MFQTERWTFYVYCFHHQHHHWLNTPSWAKAFCRTLHLHLAAFSATVTLLSTPSSHLRTGLSCGSHASWSGIENPFVLEVTVLHVQHVQPSVINLLLYQSSLNQHIVYVSVIFDYISVCDRDKYNFIFFFHGFWMHFNLFQLLPDFLRHMLPLAWLSVV